ncbi:MAG: hypothetical protein IKC79_02630 [Clostridia bacterium]|nr:hypothetical protein [Clostridia bacterium]
MKQEFDSSMEMTRYWIDIYKKIKNGTATDEERAQMDKFTYNYIDYINETGSFYITGRFVSPTGYRLGVICDKNKERHNKGLLKESTVTKLESLGFFWGKKDAWLSTIDNMTPVRYEMVRLLGIEDKVLESENVIYTYVIDNVTYASLRDIEHKGKLNHFWSNFWEHYVDYVERAHTSFIPGDYVSQDGYELGEISQHLRESYENKTMQWPVYKWLNSVGFGWNEYSSNMEILKYNADTHKKRLNLGRERVIKRYVDRVNVDNFCLHYMHYVAGTNCYDTPVEYVSQDGYKLGENAMAYQKLYAMGALPSTAIKCLNVLGFPLPQVQQMEESQTEAVENSINAR